MSPSCLRAYISYPAIDWPEVRPCWAFAELFEKRWCSLAARRPTPPLKKLSDFWRRCGSNAGTMDPQHHDMMLAIVSHLPHIIAYNPRHAG
nr:prephenate dehydrogenase dimerization domain-containing protein [Bradyrhizobium elkanii]